MGQSFHGGVGFFQSRHSFSMLKLLCLILTLGVCAILCACLKQKPFSLQGTLTGQQRWSGVVRLSGDVTIEKDAQVFIEPGTLVLFLPPEPGTDNLREHPHFTGSELIVQGRLLAAGRPDAPIVFRYVDPLAEPGSWGGINIQGSPQADFLYCRFEQANSAIHSNESEVQIRESVFERNLVGIRFNSSRIAINHNTLRHNGTGIRFHFGSPEIRFNRIENNDKGIFITSHPRQYLIADNVISGNDEAQVVLGEEVPEDVDMKGNYWGGLSRELIERGFFDGQIDDYLGRVIYEPYSPVEIEGAGASWNR